jgi:hypothetical protein
VVAQATVDGSPKTPGDGNEPREEASQTCSVLRPTPVPFMAALDPTLVADDGEPTATPLRVPTPLLVDEARDLDGDEHDPDLLPVGRAGSLSTPAIVEDKDVRTCHVCASMDRLLA